MKQEKVKQSNEICRREWKITPLGHNLVMCVLAEYQKMNLVLGDMEKPPSVRIPIKKLLSGQKGIIGGNQRVAIRKMLDNASSNKIIWERIELENGTDSFRDMYCFPIFQKIIYRDKNKEIECALNPELNPFWHSLTGGHYTTFYLNKILQLPLNNTAHLLYQHLMSLKYKKQCELDFDKFKLELGCEYMDMRNFTRRVLVKYQKEFTEGDILHWEYELVRGRYKKITKIRIVFPEEQKKPQADTAKKEKVKSENWGWIEKQDPEVVEMAYEARDNGTYPNAINSLSGILNGTPPEKREQALIEFKAEIESRKHQQVLF